MSSTAFKVHRGDLQPPEAALSPRLPSIRRVREHPARMRRIGQCRGPFLSRPRGSLQILVNIARRLHTHPICSNRQGVCPSLRRVLTLEVGIRSKLRSDRGLSFSSSTRSVNVRTQVLIFSEVIVGQPSAPAEPLSPACVRSVLHRLQRGLILNRLKISFSYRGRFRICPCDTLDFGRLKPSRL